jgi:pyruvate dehydrogenase E2 component (dihydrolipoamide acetyltransferase)
MPFDILAPPLSQTMETVILIQWEKHFGDSVTKGEALFVVETDKATLEIESPASGFLGEILAEPGSEVMVGSKIGTILAKEEIELSHKRETTAEGAQIQSRPETKPAKSVSLNNALKAERKNRVFASPRARRLARLKKMDLSLIQATGPRNMVIEQDIIAFLDQKKTEPKDTLPARNVALTNIRKTISRRMLESHQTTAPVTLTREVDATELKRLRDLILQEPDSKEVRPSYTDLLISIVAHCLVRHPNLNGTFDGETFELVEEVHMGLAVDTKHGLLVPVIRSAQKKGIRELAIERKVLVERTLSDKITPEELLGGTFTITNLGTFGIDAFTPIINRPQIAILGVGRIHPAPGVINNEIVIRELMYLSLTFDHRVVDGGPAARFLGEIVRLIEIPNLIWMYIYPPNRD